MCVYRRAKFPKYVCLVAWLGEQLLKKQILKIILDILWYNGINSYQYNIAWATLLLVLGKRFCCLLVPLKVTPHHAWVSMSHYWVNNKCYRVKGWRWRWLTYALSNFLLCNTCYVFSEATTTALESFTNSTGKHLC